MICRNPTALEHSNRHSLCHIRRVKINLRFKSFRIRIFFIKIHSKWTNFFLRNSNYVLRNLVLQINLPVLTLMMPHKLRLSLFSSAVVEIPRAPLWRIIMTFLKGSELLPFKKLYIIYKFIELINLFITKISKIDIFNMTVFRNLHKFHLYYNSFVV